MKTNAAAWLRLLTGLALCLGAVAAQAQATRTWISGVGDDVNPCSRTAPCKTFAGASSKTAAGGMINVLDSSNFGALTIAKSLIIDGHGQTALVVGPAAAMTVNSVATGLVTVRNLALIGVGATTGVQLLSGATVFTLDNVSISGFTKGFDAGPTITNPKIVVRDVQIRSAQTGINVEATGAVVTLERVTLSANATGLSAAAGVVTIADSQFLHNGTAVAAGAGGVNSNGRNRFFGNTIDGRALTLLPTR